MQHFWSVDAFFLFRRIKSRFVGIAIVQRSSSGGDSTLYTFSSWRINFIHLIFGHFISHFLFSILPSFLHFFLRNFHSPPPRLCLPPSKLPQSFCALLPNMYFFSFDVRFCVFLSFFSLLFSFFIWMTFRMALIAFESIKRRRMKNMKAGTRWKLYKSKIDFKVDFCQQKWNEEKRTYENRIGDNVNRDEKNHPVCDIWSIDFS